MPELSGDSPERRVFVVVHRVLAERSVHHTVTADDDLREAGLTSLDMIGLVLLLEAEFGFLIPETSIMPTNFRSVAAITSLVTTLIGTT
jgi:acyl carrier protein